MNYQSVSVLGEGGEGSQYSEPKFEWPRLGDTFLDTQFPFFFLYVQVKLQALQ